ncbi:MAG: MOSC domain-containing protein [Micropepsaceae bacterium]
MPHVESLYRYPVKGLSPEALSTVTLTPGETFPHDRAWAIEQGAPQFDPDAPRHFPKIKFLMLMRDEKLAALETHLDDETATLTIKRGGKQVSRAQLSTPVGRGIAEQFFAAYLGAALPGKPRVVTAPGFNFTDVPQKYISLINLASVRDVERVAGAPVDPLRFRGNIHVEGLEPWAEKSLTGRTFAIGPARATVAKQIVRCAATNVNPATAERDMRLPQLLDEAFGANLCGIYLDVIEGGRIAPGDEIRLID